MKKLLVLMFLFASLATVGAAQAEKELPPACSRLLDKNFRGWKYKIISPEITKFVREHSQGKAEPNFITGDWNGDGAKDYAVLIRHGMIPLEDNRSIPRDVSIACVSGKSGFKHFVLDTFGDYLMFEKKGATAYDFNTDSRVRFKTDAIFVGVWEKAGRTFVWNKNKFIYFQTSD